MLGHPVCSILCSERAAMDASRSSGPEWGGGEIWFDGELLRKNGQFLPKDLQPLNPERLK